MKYTFGFILLLLLILPLFGQAIAHQWTVVYSGDTQPSVGVQLGHLWFNTTNGEIFWYDGSAWVRNRNKVIRVTPATGATLSAGNRNGNIVLLIDPAGTLASLTVNFPNTPSDGDIATISTSQTITSLTLGNGTILGTVTTLSANGFAQWIYNAASNKWFRIG